MVEKGMSCVKYLLFAFNLLFFLFGICLIGVGIYAQVKLNTYLDFFSNDANVNAVAILIIVVGVVTLVVGFFGCCGAIKENHCMTMTFSVLITIILICEIGGGIAGYVLKGKVNNLLRDGMIESMENYNKSGYNGVTNVWNNAQREFKCCGVNSSADWTSSSYGEIPESCCGGDGTSNCKGCLPQIEDFLVDKIGIVAGIAVGLAVVELLGIILACCLGRAIRNESGYA